MLRFLNLDADDFSDPENSDNARDGAEDQQLLADGILDEDRKIIRRRHANDDEQDERNQRQDPRRQPAFGRQRLDLALQAEAATNDAGDLTEYFRQIPAGLQ